MEQVSVADGGVSAAAHDALPSFQRVEHASILEGDILAFETWRRTYGARPDDQPPEIRLMEAVLLDALGLISQGNAHIAAGGAIKSACLRREYADAQAWLLNSGPYADRYAQAHPFSSQQVCEALGISPAALREHLSSGKSVGTRGDRTRVRHGGHLSRIRDSGVIRLSERKRSK